MSSLYDFLNENIAPKMYDTQYSTVDAEETITRSDIIQKIYENYDSIPLSRNVIIDDNYFISEVAFDLFNPIVYLPGVHNVARYDLGDGKEGLIGFRKDGAYCIIIPEFTYDKHTKKYVIQGFVVSVVNHFAYKMMTGMLNDYYNNSNEKEAALERSIVQKFIPFHTESLHDVLNELEKFFFSQKP